VSGKAYRSIISSSHRLQTVYPNVLLHLRLVESNRLGVKPLLSSLTEEE